MSELSKRLQAGAVLTSLLVAGAAGSAAAQESAAKGEFRLPDQAAAWVNSTPISLSALKGKAAVLWFYDEQCPNCKKKWPTLQAEAKKYDGKPIVFIAVNSGTSRFEVEQYAREVGLKWPVIVDSTRHFETLCGIGEISLKNIYQLGMIMPDGHFAQGNADLAAAADKALADAKWKVDPAGIPSTLRTAWLAVEFGNPAAAATAVKKSLNSPKPEIQEAAGKLHEAVQTEVQESLSLAEQWLEGKQKWEAYKIYTSVKERFGGYDLPTDVAAKMKELETDTKVKNEITAGKAFEAAAKLLRNASASSQRSAVTRLKKLVMEHGDTEAGAEAQQYLTKLEEGE